MTDEKRIIIPSGLARWFRVFADDVLSGRISLEDVLECADADMQQSGQELCPSCARVVRPGTPAYRNGICTVCHLHRLRDAHREKLAELAAKREVNAAKRQLSRARKSSGVLPERMHGGTDYSDRVPLDQYEPKPEPLPAAIRNASRERYGRTVYDTDEPTGLITCDTCGTTYRDHGAGDAVCEVCAERSERRAVGRKTRRAEQ